MQANFPGFEEPSICDSYMGCFSVASMDSTSATEVINKLSLGLAILLIVGYALGLPFTLKTHRESFAAAEHAATDETRWPIGLALTTLAAVTILVALVSEIFVESVQEAAKVYGMTPAFAGFVVVALVGGAAEMASAFSGARRLKFCERPSRPAADEADESGKSCRARTRSAGCPQPIVPQFNLQGRVVIEGSAFPGV
ncbi:hypothetical protein FHT70_001016 [Rhizobium sp. BK049]|nr:hypothetical protein [Rhizobium sp. BK049]